MTPFLRQLILCGLMLGNAWTQEPAQVPPLPPLLEPAIRGSSSAAVGGQTRDGSPEKVVAVLGIEALADYGQWQGGTEIDVALEKVINQSDFLPL